MIKKKYISSPRTTSVITIRGDSIFELISGKIFTFSICPNWWFFFSFFANGTKLPPLNFDFGAKFWLIIIFFFEAQFFGTIVWLWARRYSKFLSIWVLHNVVIISWFFPTWPLKETAQFISHRIATPDSQSEGALGLSRLEELELGVETVRQRILTTSDNDETKPLLIEKERV